MNEELTMNLEIVKDFNGLYYANLYINDTYISDLPEYVDYKTLRKALNERYSYELLYAFNMLIPPLKKLKSIKWGRKTFLYLFN